MLKTLEREAIYTLSFAEIKILREDIAEVLVREGVEMDSCMVDQYHDFLLTHLRAPFSLLVNKVHAYSYTPLAQQKLATLKEIHAMAVVSYRQVTKFSTETLLSFPRENPWNLKIFSNRDEALAWLMSEQRRLAFPRQGRRQPVHG